MALLPQGTSCRGGVCLSSPSCSPAAGYSYTFRYRHASQTKEGEGGVRLSEALEQILGAVSTLRDSSWSLATVFSFHTELPAGIESPHPTQTGQQSNQASATGVCVPQQGQNNQFQPHPPQVVQDIPQPHSHPSPSPFRTGGLGRNLSYLTKSKWRRKKSGLARTSLRLTPQQFPPPQSFIGGFVATHGKSEMDSPRVTSGTLGIKNMMALEARSNQQEGWKRPCGS